MKKLLLLIALASSTANAEPPRLLVGTDPIGLVHDSYALTASYALSDHVAARGEIQLQRDDFDSLEVWHYRASLPLFLDRTFHGPFIEPGFVQMHATYMNYDIRTFGPSMMVGYQWTFHDRYSIAGAFGESKIWSTSSTPGVLYAGGGPEWYVRVGYVF